MSCLDEAIAEMTTVAAKGEAGAGISRRAAVARHRQPTLRRQSDQAASAHRRVAAANARNWVAPLPRYDEPCIVANVVGSSSASCRASAPGLG
jgi:hypothetical protein